MENAVFSFSAEVEREEFSGGLIRGRLNQSGQFLSEWAALVAGLPQADPFLHPAWMQSFANAFASHHEASIITARREAVLCGVLPLMTARSFFCNIPAPTLRSISGLHSCRFDLVASRLMQEEVAAVMWRQLRATPSWVVIEALDVPFGGGFEEIMRVASRDGFLVSRWPTRFSPYLSIPELGADPLRNCPYRYRNARARLNGSLRRLAEVGDVRFEVAQRPEVKQIEAFIELEASGWKGKSGGAIAKSPAARTFYLEMARSPSLREMSRLYSLWVGATPVAMELGLVMNRCYYSPKATYNEAFSRFSPGQLLVRHIIQALAAEGVRCYDFLGARARFKSVWAGEVREHAHCYIFRPSLRGRLLHTYMERVAPCMRRIKYSLFGNPQAV